MADGRNSAGESDVEEREEEKDQSGSEDLDDSPKEIFTLKVLLIIKDAQQGHGLRHGDYQCYRSYCSRRIRRIRKMLHFVQGNKKHFRKKDVTEEVLSNEKYLYIPLMGIERAWSYCMQLKQEATSEQRKRFHLISRLRKAAKLAQQFEALCVESARCDARTKLEVQAYAAFIRGTLAFEQRKWTEAIQDYTQSQTIYERLASALSENEAAAYKARAEEMVPSLRFCAYSIGDKEAGEELAKMRVGQNEILDDLLKETRAHQAAALSQVTWRGRTVGVQHEKVRSFLLGEQQLSEQLDQPGCDQLELVDNFLMECKDALNVLRDELRQDPAFKLYSSEKGGGVSAQHYLYTYLSYLRITNTVRRNLIIVDNMRRLFQNKQKGADGRKVRLQDIVRLYELVVQNLQELPNLAGLEEDQEVRKSVNTQLSVYTAFRCFFIGQGYETSEKWPEAMALYTKAEQSLKSVIDEISEEDLKSRGEKLLSEVVSAKCMVQANCVLAAKTNQKPATDKQNDNKDNSKTKSLFCQMDAYVEDEMAASNCLIELPPPLLPFPCKPLFFDLSLNSIELPDISQEAGVKKAADSEASQSSQSAGGLTGLVRGLWGGWGGGK